VPEPELSDPKAREEPGEPSQAGGAGLGLDPGTEIEVTTVDSYDEAPRVYTTTLELLESVLARDIEEYFKAEVKSDLRETLFCDIVEEVFTVDINEDANMIVVVVRKDELYTVKRYISLRNVEYLERKFIYVEGETWDDLEVFNVGYIKGFYLLAKPGECYYAVYPRFEKIARDIIRDLTGDMK
jgi:hypothetical protein